MSDAKLSPSVPQGDRILAMRQEDLDAVCRLEAAAQPQPWSRQHFVDELANPIAAVDLYWHGDALAGFLCSWLIAGELQIQNLATDPVMRRRGIALRLIEHVMTRSLATGLTSVCLEVRAGNSAAIALYAGCGFRVSGRRGGYYPDGEDALIMSMEKVGRQG